MVLRTLIQDNKKMATNFASLASQRYKRMDYRYDLISGNVLRMSVQNGSADQWHHAYLYDADNRITAAYTNSQTPIMPLARLSSALQNELVYNADWEEDAAYYYYKHGPLARTEIGEDQLQGFDYLYNLQGWMKGINAISAENDPGKDGIQPSSGSNPNQYFGKDLAAFSLSYFNNDYTPINGQAPIASINSSSHPASNSSELFNGNIRYMQTRLTDPTTGAAMPMLNAYQYDQLNRLKASRSYENGLSANAWNPTAYNNSYFNAFTYDAMGNILTQERHKRDGTKIEDMSYQYQYANGMLQRNRLYHINDAVASTTDLTDIDDMGTFTSTVSAINTNNNYSYDEEGRLTKDVQEEISKIVWRVDGKVKEIQRGSDTSKRYIRFDYDAMGHRIAKHVYDNTGVSLKKSTYYILDAQGNQVSMYEHLASAQTAQYLLVERNMFGSSRLGTKDDHLNMLTATVTPNSYTRLLGTKKYEFTNHLGNVLSIFCDVKVPLDNNSDGVVDSYRVCLQNTSDYSPFGVSLDGRTMEGDFYRWGFGGHEKVDESNGEGNQVDMGDRWLDMRLGRTPKIDSKASKYPAISLYAYALNNPIKIIDPDGRDIVVSGEAASDFTTMTAGFLSNISITKDEKTGILSYSLVEGAKKKNLTQFEQTLVHAIDADKVIQVVAINSSDKVLFDADVRDGGGNEVDMGDFSLLNGKLSKFQEALVGHFLQERLCDKNFSLAHDEGLEKETNILQEKYPDITSRSHNLERNEIEGLRTTNYDRSKSDYFKLLDYKSSSEKNSNALWLRYDYKSGEIPNLNNPSGVNTTNDIQKKLHGSTVPSAIDN